MTFYRQFGVLRVLLFDCCTEPLMYRVSEEECALSSWKLKVPGKKVASKWAVVFFSLLFFDCFAFFKNDIYASRLEWWFLWLFNTYTVLEKFMTENDIFKCFYHHFAALAAFLH